MHFEAYTGLWKWVQTWKQAQNCMRRRAFGKSNKSVHQHPNSTVDAMVTNMQFSFVSMTETNSSPPGRVFQNK